MRTRLIAASRGAVLDRARSRLALIRSLALIAVLAGPASADPEVSVRVAAAFGTFEELTWEAPEVNLVAAFEVGPKAFLSIMGGYGILDNHNYLSDGRSGRLELGGGAVFDKLRVGGIVGLSLIGFHSDPDLLADHPDVDLVVSRGGLVPTAGFEVSRALGTTLRAGLFARVALRRLEVFDTATDRETARLILGGAYLGFAIR